MTQHEKILYTMLRHPEKEWFYAPDFMRVELGDYFVGYEASPRISELVKMYPDLIGSQKKGKYRYVKINWEYVSNCLDKGRGLFLDNIAEELAIKNCRFGVPYQSKLL